MDQILLVEDTEALRTALAKVLSAEGFQVASVGSAEEAYRKLSESETFGLILTDLKLPGESGLDVVRFAHERHRHTPVVVMTAYGTVELAVEAMKFGARDFITKPFDPRALVTLLRQVMSEGRIIDREAPSRSKRTRTIVFQSRGMELVLKQAKKVAALTSPVLILGESGVGKELVARYIHENSPRSGKPFVAVNCASLPGELLESEVFGHEAGAFTGAMEQRLGLFEVADTGTIFLDEIGTMPSQLQTKLLRVLQESEIKRLGSTKLRKIDTRVVSATNANLEKSIREATFREDLYYRLSVVVLEIPPLRERVDDIPLLVNFYLKTICQEFQRPVPPLSSEIMQLLCDYHWPGNIRQLENVIERALILYEGALNPDCFLLPRDMSCQEVFEKRTLQEAVSEVVKKTEVEIISKVLTRTGGNKSRAAEILGVSYKTLLNKVKEYQLDRDDTLATPSAPPSLVQ